MLNTSLPRLSTGGVGGLSSPTVNLNRTRLRLENLVFYGANACSDRKVMQLAGVLNKDEQVRHLRSVLADEDAKAILCDGRPGGLQEAIDHVQDKRRADRRRAENAEHLRDSTLLDLARAFSDRVGRTTLTEISDIENRPEELSEIVARLREGADKLASFIPK